MRRLAIVVWVCSMVLVGTAEGAPRKAKPQKPKRPDTSYLEKWKPKKKVQDSIVSAVRSLMGKAKVKHDEIEWIGPYRWRDEIIVIWLHYKYVAEDGGAEPTIKETIQPFIIKRYPPFSNGQDYRWGAQFSYAEGAEGFRAWAKSIIAEVERKEKADKLLTGKRVEPGRKLPPLKKKKPAPTSALRTWTDATGKFSVEAELLDYRKGMVTLLTKDQRAIRLQLSKLSKADQRYVATRKK